MPDNAIFYHLAYGAAALVYGGYVISIYVRARRARDRARANEALRGTTGGQA
jgi:hypothetical protein